MNHEQEPRIYNFPWQYDTEHFLRVASDHGQLEMRPSNTEVYMYTDDHELDHIYVRMEWLDDDTSRGYRLFRELCDRLGEGAFDALVEQLIDHGYDLAPDEEPLQSDIDAWESVFKREYLPNKIDKVVKFAMEHFTEEWEYYQDEPGWGVGGNGESNMDRQ